LSHIGVVVVALRHFAAPRLTKEPSMPRKIAIDSKFAEPDEGSEGVDVRPALPPSLQDDDESQAIRIYDGGVTATGTKADALAVDLEMTFQKLSDYRNGKRTIALHRLVRLIRKDETAALYVIGELCAMAGLAAPRKKRSVTRRDAERQLTMELRRLSPVFELLRRSAAESLGTDEDGIDDALDEVTGEVRFAK
jgi:hypothetical protein